MKPYRIKHKNSGLYYQPVRGRIKSNLSKNGKVYITKLNPLVSTTGDYIYIEVDKEARVFKKVEGLFPLDKYGNINGKCPKEQFEIEEL